MTKIDSEDYFMTTGQKIKKLRETNQLTQNEMADKMHISTQTYGRLERGETQMTEHRLEQIANILNVDMAKILTTPEDKIILLVTENTWSDQHHGHAINYCPNHDIELQKEIEKLQSIIENQKQLLAEKDKVILSKDEQILLLQELLKQIKSESSQ